MKMIRYVDCKYDNKCISARNYMVKNACLNKKNLANANTSFGQKQLSFVIETKRILIFFITLEYVYKYV